MAAAIKVDELVVSWLGSDAVYENVQKLIESYRAKDHHNNHEVSNSSSNNKGTTATTTATTGTTPVSPARNNNNNNEQTPQQSAAAASQQQQQPQPPADALALNKSLGTSSSSNNSVIPPFYPPSQKQRRRRRRWLLRKSLSQAETDDDNDNSNNNNSSNGNNTELDAAAELSWLPPDNNNNNNNKNKRCVRDVVHAIYKELGQQQKKNHTNNEDEDDEDHLSWFLAPEHFVRITKEVFHFPSFFNGPLYNRIVQLWNQRHHQHVNKKRRMDVVTLPMLEWFWHEEMEPHDASERFFRLLKQPQHDYIARDDFLPYIKELLNDHPGLEFLANHAEFQEKYAVTVITRIFYHVNKCHSGRITLRQVCRSDLLEAFDQVDQEEDINKVTKYFSYEHFYVLYCRFWELDHDRDYRITREDLLKYGDHSLSHMIVDRIFEAAPRPFFGTTTKDYLSYEDFIFFMLSEEDKANDVSVRYWFACVDVDGDGKLNNMEMRSFYAVQLHRMQCMGHEIVPFEDMLCQMMDMIKPANPHYLVAEDFLQPECLPVSGALFDALFNLNKYLMFEQRDPFVERQKREDEFETDWDRFACIDYNRLAMEEEAREEEAMEIDWVTVDDEEEDNHEFVGGGGGGGKLVTAVASEAPF